MKYYATLLNLSKANKHCLNQDDIVDRILQESILDKMIWGSADTEGDSIINAVDNMILNGIFETFECEYGAKDILQTSSGKDALRHLWLDEDFHHGNSKLIPLPCHNALVDFCNRYTLPETAARELASFFKSFLHTS